MPGNARKKIAAIIGAIFIIAAGAAVWSAIENDDSTEGGISVSGTIEAEEVVLSAPVGGVVNEITVEEGDTVQSGEVLVMLNASAVEARVRQAEAGLAAANVRLSLSQDSPREEDRTLATAEVDRAQAVLDEAHALLAQLTLSAPIGGIVQDLFFNVGEIIAPGAQVARIIDLSRVDVIVFVSEQDLGFIRIGDRAEVSVDSYPGRVFMGTIVRISTEAEFTPSTVQTKEDRTTIVYEVNISVTNRDKRLKAGMPADAVIVPSP